jgi:hypothetical protein
MFDFSAPWQDLGLSAVAFGVLLILALLALTIILALWVIGAISRGGLIYAADMLSGGQTTNFSDSMRSGWKKGWRLIGISLAPTIPVLLLILSVFVSAGIYNGSRVILQEGEVLNRPNAVLLTPMLAVTCLLLLLSLTLSLLRAFANRACMLEDHGIIGSYRRGLEVLGDNLGPAVVLFLLQIAVSIAIVLILFLPGILVAFCCILWPLLLLAQGAFEAFYSTLWTLAWNQWTKIEPNQLTR